MTICRNDQGHVRTPEPEFEAILARAAEEGAKRALADVGLEGKEAALDVRDLRSLVEMHPACSSHGGPDHGADERQW